MAGGQLVYFSDAPRARVTLPRPDSSARMLFFDARTERTRIPVAGTFFSADFAEENFDIVVFRGNDREFAKEVAEDPALKLMRARLPAMTLTSGQTQRRREPQIDIPAWSGLTNLPDLAELREAELLGLLHARDAILADAGTHYAIASGYHQRQYVRLRDALQDTTDVTRLADWLMPWVTRTTALLGDRPSLLPLIQAVALESMRRFGWEIKFATLESFPRHTRSAAQSISDLVASGARSLLIVVGVDYEARHENELRVLAPSGSTAVCLVDLTPEGRSSEIAAVHYPQPRLASVRGECEACPDLELYEVDVRTEERRLSKRRLPRKITYNLVKKQRSFWKAVHEAEALRLHRAVHYPDASEQQTRHRPVDFHTARLLQHEGFRDVCRKALLGGSEPDVVLIPTHTGSSAVASLIAEVYPQVEPTICMLDRGRLNDPALDAISKARQVMIADNEIITGKTVRRLLDAIKHRLGDRVWATKEFSVFAAVVSTTNAAALRAVRNRLHTDQPRADALLMGAEIPLPADDACPWCEEAHWLRTLETKLPQHARFIARRARALQEPHVAANDLVVYPGISNDDRDVDRAVVNTSVLGERVSAGIVFGALASAVQTLRYTDDPDAEGLPYFFDLVHMLTAWWGGPMYAGALRSLDEEELKYSAQDDALEEAWSERSSKINAAELVEFAWAAVQDKLPPVLVPRVYDTLEEHASEHEALELLRDVLAMVRPPD